MCAALASLLRNATSPTEKRGRDMKAKTEAKIEAKKEEGPERRRPIKERRIESQVPRWARSAF
jgi:hypothetical protein